MLGACHLPADFRTFATSLDAIFHASHLFTALGAGIADISTNLTLLLIEDRGIQLLLKEIESESLIVALKGAPQEMRDKFLKNMSSRASEMLKEDMEARGPAKVADVEKAQQNILKVCRKLEEEGRIVISGAGEALV